MILFDMEISESHLSHQLTFYIHVVVKDNNIFHMVIDKGATTCVMSLSRWKDLGSPILVPSPNVLKAFDGHTFQPYGILTTFLKELGGKIVLVEVDTPLE